MWVNLAPTLDAGSSEAGFYWPHLWCPTLFHPHWKHLRWSTRIRRTGKLHFTASKHNFKVICIPGKLTKTSLDVLLNSIFKQAVVIKNSEIGTGDTTLIPRIRISKNAWYSPSSVKTWNLLDSFLNRHSSENVFKQHKNSLKSTGYTKRPHEKTKYLAVDFETETIDPTDICAVWTYRVTKPVRLDFLWSCGILQDSQIERAWIIVSLYV